MPKLTKAQKEQLERQMEAHRHQKYEIDIDLDGLILKGFVVHPDVMRPERMTSLKLGQWLYQNKLLYRDKVAMDMGCGSGFQGVVMGLAGAKRVIFSDVSEAAIENTKENVEEYELNRKSVIVHGDLFENVSEKSDVIVFNHPFFPIGYDEFDPKAKAPVLVSMLGGDKLIHRFLDETRKYLQPRGRVIMPYFHLLGRTNNPEIQGPKHGYTVVEKYSERNMQGLQRGKISIYELRPKK